MSKFADRIILIPVTHLFHLCNATVQGAACICLTVKCRHDLSFFYYVHLTKFHRIHMEFFCQFINCCLNGKKSLCCTISTISSRRHNIRINHIVNKAECLCFSVKRNRFVPGQSDCCRPMFPIGTCVRNGVQINSTDSSIFHSSKFHMHFHLMSRRRSCHAFLTGKNNLTRLLCHPGHICRIDLTDRCLFCSKTSSDTRLADTYL